MTTKKGESGASGRKRLYEIVEERRPRRRMGFDPIDDVLLSEERELIQEHKRLRLEQLIERRRREVEKMKEGVVDGTSLPSNTDFLNMAKFMADLNPEEAQRVRSSYTFFKMAEKGGSGGMQLLPMLLNYAKTNPGASENQMINYLKLMDSQLMKGLEIAKTMNPSKQDSPMEFLKLMKELVIEGVRNPVMQAIKEAQPTPGVFEQILTNPDLFSRAKDIGMFGGSSNVATSQFDLQIEQLRGERQLSMKKLDLEMHRDALQRQAEDRKTETLLAFLGPLAAVFAEPTSQKMREFGRQQAAAYNPIRTSLPPKPPQENTVNLRCSCGYQGTIPLTDPPQTEITCPKCEQVLTVNRTEIPQTEEKTVDTPENQATEDPEGEWRLR